MRYMSRWNVWIITRKPGRMHDLFLFRQIDKMHRSRFDLGPNSHEFKQGINRNIQQQYKPKRYQSKLIINFVFSVFVLKQFFILDQSYYSEQRQTNRRDT